MYKPPMRVLQVVTTMNLGGIETMLMTLYRNIDRTKVQFDFLVHREERGMFDDEIEKLGGRIYRMSALSARNYFKYTKQLNLFFKEHRGYSTVHSHLNANSFLILKIAKKYKIPNRIAHAHTDTSGKGVKSILKTIQKYTLRRCANSFFACSDNAALWLFGQKRINETVVFKNAINSEVFRFDELVREEYRRNYNLESKFIYGHIGRFSIEKNHLFLIDLFYEIYNRDKKSHLILVGDGDLRRLVEERIQQLGIGDSVSLFGVRNDAAQIMSMMDCFILPSLFEGLPLVAVEAQCSGLPTYVSANISSEVFISNTIQSFSLSSPIEEIVMFILESRNKADNIDRTNSYKAIVSHGYDVQSNVVFSQNLYIKNDER